MSSPANEHSTDQAADGKVAGNLPDTRTWRDTAGKPPDPREKDRENLAAVMQLLPDFAPTAPSTAPPSPQATAPAHPGKHRPARPMAPPRLRRWLAATTLLMAVAALALHFVRPVQRDGAAESQDVVALDRTQLPDGDLLAEARMRQGVLIGVVAAGWGGLDDTRRQEKLQAWLRHGQAQGVTAVILLDSHGRPLARASSRQAGKEGAPATQNLPQPPRR